MSGIFDVTPLGRGRDGVNFFDHLHEQRVDGFLTIRLGIESFLHDRRDDFRSDLASGEVGAVNGSENSLGNFLRESSG